MLVLRKLNDMQAQVGELQMGQPIVAEVVEQLGTIDGAAKCTSAAISDIFTATVMAMSVDSAGMENGWTTKWGATT